MMGAASTVLVRFRLTLYPTIAFMGYIIFQINRQQSHMPGASLFDTLPPAGIIVGLFLMFNATSPAGYKDFVWTKQYWLGEALVIFIFFYNSLSTYIPMQSRVILVTLGFVSALAALWFRGSVWNYAIVLGMVTIIALLAALAFPIIELLLDAILTEKLRKVGDKVRQHHQLLQNYYEKKARQ
jgi:hypothetical protein